MNNLIKESLIKLKQKNINNPELDLRILLKYASKKNNDLSLKIKELSSSSHALENFARYNLGLVKNDETFVHVIKK